MVTRTIFPVVDTGARAFSSVQLLNSVCMDLSWNHSLGVPFDAAWLG